MSETLQMNAKLRSKRQSQKAYIRQMRAELEGRESWIDEQRSKHKEIKRLRKELSYEVRLWALQSCRELVY